MSAPSQHSLLEVRQLTKRFPGVLALHDVGLKLQKGEVLAVIGENGAGKSTLMKILAGVLNADSGKILINGNSVEIGSVRNAIELGIVLIHQELNLSDNLDIGANIFLGREPTRLGLLNKRRISEESKPVLSRIGLDFSPDTLVSQLSIGQQQMVEIAKALSAEARILIMDEPTSSLSQHESEQLFKVVRQLRSNGVSIVYISHRLGEVSELADRVLVLRDGEIAGELNKQEISHDRMVQLMVGRDVTQFYQHETHPRGDVALEIRGLRTLMHPRHTLNLQVRTGEIVGLAGLVGAGRTEMLRAVFGFDRMLEGDVFVGGHQVELSHPVNAIQAGMGLVPEDRKDQGLVLEMSVRENLSLPSLRRDQRNGFLNRAEERQITTRMIRELAIKTPGEEQIAQYLSGGNQQKVVLGKWLALNPKVLLLDEPTRGIDVGAKREIYRLMERLAENGVAVLFVSSEMEEILGMSDRALVMHEGRITGKLERDELSEEAVMHLATGRLRDENATSA